ncbi:Topoisomerase 1-associated factor 1 [Perkinsus olseni]|uniref:Topoisomerase 1-associated factor 1 n=1 Tax=Perkinsus olseni TaxID=32597 RepID=A0A7J6NST0_PEROL|nr:Topoisomerase 1-associated factor 1 [Perkinsus olseni]
MPSRPAPEPSEEDEVVDLEDDEMEEGYTIDLEEDKSLEEELHCSVEGLGCWHAVDNEQVYLAPSDAFECIRDLLRAFREDVGTSRRVHRLLGKWDVVKQKLVPMLISHRDDLDDKCFQILKLMVILTMPVNKGDNSAYCRSSLTAQFLDTPELDTHLQYLQNYKAAIGLNEDVLTIFMTILDQCVGTSLIINEEPSSSTQEVVDDATKRLRAQQQELVFTLVRNLLEIPDPRPGDPGFNPAHRNLQMTMLQELYESGFLDFAVLVMENALSGPAPTINRNKQLLWLYFEILYHACAKIRPMDLITIDARFKPDLTALINRSILTHAASRPIMTRHSRFGKRVAVNMSNDGPSSGVTAGGTATKQLIAGRQRHYRNKLVDEAPNVFQDRTFTDVDVGSKVPTVGDDPGGALQEVISADGGVSMINLAVWEKFLRSFASFIVDMIDRVFAGITAAVIKAITDSEVEQEYDVVRALNFIAWALDFQRQSHEYHVAAINRDRAAAVARANQAGTPLPPPVELTEMVIDITSVEPALNVEATELVARQLRVHSKEAKSLKKGGARNVVVLRALLEQIRMIRTCLRSPDKETAHVADMLLSNVLYEDVQTQLVWLCKTGFKSTVADPRVLTLSVQCLAELLKAMDKVVRQTDNKYKFAAGKRRRRRKGGRKGRRGKSKKSAGVEHTEEGEDGREMDSDEEEEEESGDVDDYDNIRATDTSKEAILMDLAHTDTINNLMYMLGDGYLTNGPSINRDCVYLLTQMITLRPCNIAFFFQLSHLIVLHKVLTDPKVHVNPQQHSDVIKFCLAVAKRFLQNAMKTSCLYVEAIFPKLRGGRGGQLMSMEAEFTGILTDYQDDDSKDILERMHEGEADGYERLASDVKSRLAEIGIATRQEGQDDDEGGEEEGECIAGHHRRHVHIKGDGEREAHEEEDENGSSDREAEDDEDDDDEDGFDIDRIRNLHHSGRREEESEDDAVGFSDDEDDDDENDDDNDDDNENSPGEANKVPPADHDVPMPESSSGSSSSGADVFEVEPGLADNLPEFEELRLGLGKLLEEVSADGSSILTSEELAMLGPKAIELLRDAGVPAPSLCSPP